MLAHSSEGHLTSPLSTITLILQNLHHDFNPFRSTLILILILNNFKIELNMMMLQNKTDKVSNKHEHIVKQYNCI